MQRTHATGHANASNGSGNRMKEKFAFNVPTLVTLDSEGTEQPNGEGQPEFRYFLADHKIMWVPPEVHGAILDLRATEGDTVVITRHRDGRDQAWEVQPYTRESSAAAAIRNTATAPASRAPLASQPRRSRNEPNTAAGLPAPAQQQLPGAPEEQPYSASLYTCMCAAIRVAAEAEKFAQSIGRPLAFETSDIRAMAASLFIHQQGGR
jgi:predicted glycosyl hydrolase (DUF1957 family)